MEQNTGSLYIEIESLLYLKNQSSDYYIKGDRRLALIMLLPRERQFKYISSLPCLEQIQFLKDLSPSETLDLRRKVEKSTGFTDLHPLAKAFIIGKKGDKEFIEFKKLIKAKAKKDSFKLKEAITEAISGFPDDKKVELMYEVFGEEGFRNRKSENNFWEIVLTLPLEKVKEVISKCKKYIDEVYTSRYADLEKEYKDLPINDENTNDTNERINRISGNMISARHSHTMDVNNLTGHIMELIVRRGDEELSKYYKELFGIDISEDIERISSLYRKKIPEIDLDCTSIQFMSAELRELTQSFIKPDLFSGGDEDYYFDVKDRILSLITESLKNAKEDPDHFYEGVDITEMAAFLEVALRNQRDKCENLERADAITGVCVARQEYKKAQEKLAKINEREENAKANTEERGGNTQ